MRASLQSAVRNAGKELLARSHCRLNEESLDVLGWRGQ
jgi:hypothetical protein